MNSKIHHDPGNQPTNNFVADKEWENGARVSENFESFGL